MRFLFWNVKKRDLSQLISAVAREHDIDVIVLAEFESPWATLAEQLNSGEAVSTYVPAIKRGQKGNRLTLITRLPEGAVSSVGDYAGISFRTIKPPVGPEFTLGMAHLASKMFQSAESQAIGSTVISGYVARVEQKVGHCLTLLVGDFNMNPFESGVVGAAGLHAVGVRAIAARGTREILGESFRFFYNPMWRHFGSRGSEAPGTYYYSGSQQVEYFWHMVDQVFLRPELLDYFDDASIKILTDAGATSLLTAGGLPSTTVGSDHLPLVFSLDVERIQQ